MDVFADSHVPPEKLFVNNTLSPTHTDKGPVIAAGNGFVVKITPALHPVLSSVYEIMVVPAAIGMTAPVNEPTVATVVVVLLHVPPGVEEERETTELTQDAKGPIGVAGSGLTVIERTEKHPVGNV